MEEEPEGEEFQSRIEGERGRWVGKDSDWRL